MAAYKFELQHTGRPYGPCERIPDRAWKPISKHTTYSAAQKAMARHERDMRRVLGPSAWDDHMTIVPLRDTTLYATWYCNACGRPITRSAPWPAHTRAPYIDPAYYCERPECQQAQHEELRKHT